MSLRRIYKMNVKELRMSIGADILAAMEENGDLPLTTKFRLTKIMQEYFKADGHADELKEQGYTWRPTRDYWTFHLDEIREFMRKNRNKFLEYLRPVGEFKGEWKFVSKIEFETIARREHSDIGTRTDTYNNKVDDGNDKWPSLQMPKIKEVPLLEKSDN
jgi:hypothetical protein